MNAGFGFNGYDEHGNARWDLIDNANIWKIEVTALSCIISRSFIISSVLTHVTDS